MNHLITSEQFGLKVLHKPESVYEDELKKEFIWLVKVQQKCYTHAIVRHFASLKWMFQIKWIYFEGVLQVFAMSNPVFIRMRKIQKDERIYIRLSDRNPVPICDRMKYIREI